MFKASAIYFQGSVAKHPKNPQKLLFSKIRITLRYNILVESSDTIKIANYIYIHLAIDLLILKRHSLIS